MSEYLDKLDRHLSNIKREAQAESDPHRSSILWNYLHHGAFELSGEWEQIFVPEMTIDEPHYEMRTGEPEATILDGADAVKEFYSLIEDAQMMAIDDGTHQLFVNDEGLAEFASTVDFPTGAEILAEDTDTWFYRGVEIDDPDATYARKSRHAMYWPYTEESQLIGEMVYQIAPFEVARVEPEAVPTIEEITDVAERYFPENVDAETPYASITV